MTRPIRKACSIDGCDVLTQARGWCAKHYTRFKRNGDPLLQGLERGTDLTGQRFGRLVIAAIAPSRTSPRGKTQQMLTCLCDCGRRTVAYRSNLISGKTTSCGCRTLERAAAARRSMRLESPSYGGVHMRLRNDKGPASTYTCPCGSRAQHWSYDNSDPEEWSRADGKRRYSTDQSHYQPLCAVCHSLRDRVARSAS